VKKNRLAVGLLSFALIGGGVAFVVEIGGPATAAETATSVVTHHSLPRVSAAERAKARRAEIAKEIAAALGISVSDLHAAVKNGQSLIQIAKAHAVDPQEIANIMIAKANARVDKALAHGRIDQAQADKGKAWVVKSVERKMNHQVTVKASDSGN